MRPSETPLDKRKQVAPLQTVDRALMVLASFGPNQRDWGVSELADRFGWDKSTAQRLLAGLAARGFLVSDPVSRRYSLGPQVWRLAQDWERSGGLAEFVAPSMRQLAETTGRDVILAVPDGSYLRCVAEVSGRLGSIRITPLVGELYPAHAGALSRAYFAFVDQTLRRQILAGWPRTRFSELTITDDNELEQSFEAVVRDGYASSEGEYDPATRALAAPVQVGATIIASLAISERIGPGENELPQYLPELLATAVELGAQLAGHPDL